MQKVYVYCDVCGKLIKNPASGSGKPAEWYAARGVAEEMCDVADVCDKCEAAGRKIDVGKLVMDEWRRRARKKGPRKSAASADATDATPRRGRRKASVVAEPIADAGSSGAVGSAGDFGGSGAEAESESAPESGNESHAPPGSASVAEDAEPVERVVSQPGTVAPAPATRGAPAPVESAGSRSRRRSPEELAEAAARRLEAQEAERERRQSAPRTLSVHVEEKRAVFAALRAYREERGLGAFQDLSRRCGVSVVGLRKMMNADQVPLENWRAVGRALGVAVGSDDEVVK